MLVFKQKLCLSLARWLACGLCCIFFSSVLQQLLLGQPLAQSGVAALQSTSSPALELAYLCACLLGACVFSSPLSLEQSQGQ
jgi:hypothetical protein